MSDSIRLNTAAVSRRLSTILNAYSLNTWKTSRKIGLMLGSLDSLDGSITFELQTMRYLGKFSITVSELECMVLKKSANIFKKAISPLTVIYFFAKWLLGRQPNMTSCSISNQLKIP